MPREGTKGWKPPKDLTGMRFGQWTVLEMRERHGGSRYWLCRCDCGTERKVTSNHLLNGSSRSCGCLYRGLNNRIHGDSKTLLYKTWKRMHGRCNNVNNKSYKNYGGRGIKVCPEWDDYQTFKSWALTHGYQEGLSIERIDVNRGYAPDNCCWIPMNEQSKNRRNTYLPKLSAEDAELIAQAIADGMNRQTIWYRITRLHMSAQDAVSVKNCQCRYITYNGKTQPLSAWAREAGIRPETLSNRIDRYHWPLEDALTWPANCGVRHKKDGV